MSKTEREDHVLSPTIDADVATLRTARALQRHQEWVSHESHLIPDLLSAVGFSLLGRVINPISTGGQAYVAVRGHQVVVAFRGSGGDNLKQTVLNSLADANILRVRPREIVDVARRPHVKTHRGFYETYLEFRDEVRSRVRAVQGQEIYVTGFSLGSALASLCALDLAMNDHKNVTLCGMGTPRVGNRAFVELLEERVPHILRAVLSTDPVSRVPLQTNTARSFHHAGRLLVLHQDGMPVPLDDITGRLLDKLNLADHNRDKYAATLAALTPRVIVHPGLLEQHWGARPLVQSALRERGAYVGTEADDDGED